MTGLKTQEVSRNLVTGKNFGEIGVAADVGKKGPEKAGLKKLSSGTNSGTKR